jgi:hypothetical protein
MRMRMRRLATMGPADIALVVRASLLLVRMRVALWVLPWRRVLALLPTSLPEKRGPYPFFGTREVERLERSVRAASRIVPRSTCLTQALALTHLLSRSGHAATVRIGVTNAGGRFIAHAWVECDGVPLLSSAADVARYAPLLAWTPIRPDLFR